MIILLMIVAVKIRMIFLMTKIWKRISRQDIFHNQTHVRHWQPGAQATDISFRKSKFCSLFKFHDSNEFMYTAAITA